MTPLPRTDPGVAGAIWMDTNNDVRVSGMSDWRATTPEWKRTPWWIIYRYFGFVWRIAAGPEPYDPQYRYATERWLAKELLRQKFGPLPEDRSHLARDITMGQSRRYSSKGGR